MKKIVVIAIIFSAFLIGIFAGGSIVFFKMNRDIWHSMQRTDLAWLQTNTTVLQSLHQNDIEKAKEILEVISKGNILALYPEKLLVNPENRKDAIRVLKRVYQYKNNCSWNLDTLGKDSTVFRALQWANSK